MILFFNEEGYGALQPLYGIPVVILNILAKGYFCSLDEVVLRSGMSSGNYLGRNGPKNDCFANSV